jgi:predicted RND superfamily exporter protein
MLKAAIRTLIEFCTRWPWMVVLASTLLTVGAGVYTAQNFAINTDVSRLISPTIEWRKREIAYHKAFPQGNNILAVIDASTSEAATEAAVALRDELSEHKELVEQVSAPAETPFFAKSALLYMPTNDVRSVTGQLEQLGPLLHVLAAIPRCAASDRR